MFSDVLSKRQKEPGHSVSWVKIHLSIQVYHMNIR
jgi:hypothetical protein